MTKIATIWQMLLLIDKPKGISSHDVVDEVRRKTGIKKVGHGGTLDPNATGLLIIGVGRQSTKKLGDISRNKKKTYLAEITLGEERDTGDIEGKIISKNKDIQPNTAEIKSVLKLFNGELKQIPPAHSAIKIKGKKAYELARKGKVPKLKPRKITVFNYKLISYNYPVLKVEFEVSSGTYIRALARDIGRKLGTYGYLSALRRTKIGEYSIDNAQKLEDLK
jgi:tRNA pseudouridine55 synthase